MPVTTPPRVASGGGAVSRGGEALGRKPRALRRRPRRARVAASAQRCV